MKKLNNMYSYGEFIEVANEGVWGAIKNMFKSLFANVSKKVEQQINNFTAKIDSSKDWKTMQKVIADDNILTQKYIEEQMPNVNNLIDLRKVYYDVFNSQYIKAADLSTKTKQDNLKPSVFFKDLGNDFAKIFAYDKPEDFSKNLITNLNVLLETKAKAAQVKDEEIQAMKNDNQIQKESIYTVGDKLFEEGETTTQATTTTTQPNTQAQQPNTQAQQPNTQAPAASAEFQKLKDTSKNDIVNVLGTINKKYANFKFQGNLEGTKNLGNLSNYTGKENGKVITTYPNTVKNMAQQLRKLDKPTLLNVRKAMLPRSKDGGKKDLGAL